MAERTLLRNNKSPIKFNHHEYYDKYIKPQNTNRTASGGFIPLRDLLRKNHAERV